MFSFVFRLSCLVPYRYQPDWAGIIVSLCSATKVPTFTSSVAPDWAGITVFLCGRVEMFPAGQVGRYRTGTVPTLLLYFCVPVDRVLLCSAMCSG